MGNFRGNGAEGRGRTHVFSSTDHTYTSGTDIWQDMRDVWGGSISGSGKNAVGDDLHRETISKRGTVGSVATHI